MGASETLDFALWERELVEYNPFLAEDYGQQADDMFVDEQEGE